MTAALVDSLRREIAELDTDFEAGNGSMTIDQWQSKRAELVFKRDRVARKLERRGNLIPGSIEGIERMIVDRVPAGDRREAERLLDEIVKANFAGETKKAQRLAGELHLLAFPDHEIDAEDDPPGARQATTVQKLSQMPHTAQPSRAQRPPYKMAAADRAEYDDFRKRFADAQDALDADALIGIMKDERFTELDACAVVERASCHSTRQNVMFLDVSANQLVWALALSNVRRKLLEKRVQELESRPQLKYSGVYDPNSTYARGEFVTFGGQVWHCDVDGTCEPPRYGHGGTSPWTLVVKKGRNGNA